jgi:hypothetical protein
VLSSVTERRVIASEVSDILISICLCNPCGAGVVTDYGLVGQGVRVRIPVEGSYFPLHIVQTGSGAHRASYPMDTGGSFPLGKAAGA